MITSKEMIMIFFAFIYATIKKTCLKHEKKTVDLNNKLNYGLFFV